MSYIMTNQVNLDSFNFGPISPSFTAGQSSPWMRSPAGDQETARAKALNKGRRRQSEPLVRNLPAATAARTGGQPGRAVGRTGGSQRPVPDETSGTRGEG